MPTFDLKSVRCISPTEPGGDELYILFKPLDGIGLDATHKLGGGFGAQFLEAKYPSPGFQDVKQVFHELTYVTLYEGDSLHPNPSVDTPIGSAVVSVTDRGDDQATFTFGNVEYKMSWEIL